MVETESRPIDLLCLELLPIATYSFFGQEAELRAMEEALHPQKAGQRGFVLYGLPGSDKTQLALRYVDKHPSLFSPEIAASSFSDAAALISAAWPTTDLPIPYQGPHDQRRVVSRLRSTIHKSWLLVIDSADDIYGQDFTQYIPNC